MGKQGRSEGGAAGGVQGAGARASAGGKARTDARRGRTNDSQVRPVAWWPFWGAFLLIAAVVGVAIGYGEVQMRNLRASVDRLYDEMSTLTTNLEARGDEFSDLVSQAELRLASTVQEAVSHGTGGAAANSVEGAEARSAASPPVGPVESGDDGSGVYVRVRPGDSLWEISRALWGRGSLYPTLARENELDPAEPLPVDTLLRVPAPSR